MPVIETNMSAHRHGRVVRAFVLAGALVFLLAAVGCASVGGVPGRYQTFHDKNMDFAQVQRVAVLPFANLTPTTQAGERVRDVFSTMLQASGSVYVLPSGETSRGLSRARVAVASQPTSAEAVALGKDLGVEAVITGTVREYGEVRSGNASAPVVSISAQMIETQTGRVVWSAATTKGGISTGDRLFGGGGEPMNAATEDAVHDLINKLFK